jgi:AcrR family transcriptional regulator
MPTTTNRHELRRQATHDALREVALAKFAAEGFDNVTVAEVAEEVGVTERTFYRHFPTKESILFQDYETRLDWLSAALAMRPAGEPIFDSVLLATRSFPHDLEIVYQAAVLRTSLISGERVAGHLRIVQASFTQVFIEFIRNRLPDHPDLDLFAAVAGNSLAGALVAAVEVWGQTGFTEDVEDLVNRSVEIIRFGLEALGGVTGG